MDLFAARDINARKRCKQRVKRRCCRRDIHSQPCIWENAHVIGANGPHQSSNSPGQLNSTYEVYQWCYGGAGFGWGTAGKCFCCQGRPGIQATHLARLQESSVWPGCKSRPYDPTPPLAKPQVGAGAQHRQGKEGEAMPFSLGRQESACSQPRSVHCTMLCLRHAKTIGTPMAATPLFHAPCADGWQCPHPTLTQGRQFEAASLPHPMAAQGSTSAGPSWRLEGECAVLAESDETACARLLQECSCQNKAAGSRGDYSITHTRQASKAAAWHPTPTFCSFTRGRSKVESQGHDADPTMLHVVISQAHTQRLHQPCARAPSTSSNAHMWLQHT